jgi:hypothetical protein
MPSTSNSIGFCVAVLILVDAVQIGLHGLESGGLFVQVGEVGFGALANAQAAEQLVGVEQFRPQHFGQFATGQAAQDFHLEQPVLGMHVAEGAVQVGFVLGADVRHATFVVAHRDRTLQVLQFHHALACRLLAVDVPAGASGKHDDQQTECGQATFHGDSLLHA